MPDNEHAASLAAAKQMAVLAGGPLNENRRMEAPSPSVDACNLAMVVGAIMALDGAGLVARWMP